VGFSLDDPGPEGSLRDKRGHVRGVMGDGGDESERIESFTLKLASQLEPSFQSFRFFNLAGCQESKLRSRLRQGKEGKDGGWVIWGC